MIIEEKEKKALQSIHDLVIRARLLAYEGMVNQEIATFLDYLEHLPALMLEKDDRTGNFEAYLEEICKLYNCENIFRRYSL